MVLVGFDLINTDKIVFKNGWSKLNKLRFYWIGL